MHTFVHSKKIVLAISIFCILFFTLFSYTIKRGAMKKIDFDTTVKLQDTIDKSPRLRLSNVVGDVMEGATFFASPEVSVVGVIILTGIALYDRKKKKIRWMALGIPLLFFLLVMAELYGKTVVHHPAPPFFMIKNPTTIFPKYYINDQFSYPSGHTARAVFLSIVLFSMLHTTYEIRNTSDRLRKKKAIIVGCILCGYITLVSVSRIYLGHHWFSDIIGGFFLGSGCAVFAYFLFLHPSSNS